VKLSARKRQALFDAISDQVMRTRIDMNRTGLSSKHDAMIAFLDVRAFHAALAALGVKDESLVAAPATEGNDA
jgi:hypothetical protein